MWLARAPDTQMSIHRNGLVPQEECQPQYVTVTKMGGCESRQLEVTRPPTSGGLARHFGADLSDELAATAMASEPATTESPVS
jgi:hypothetical protein